MASNLTALVESDAPQEETQSVKSQRSKKTEKVRKVSNKSRGVAAAHGSNGNGGTAVPDSGHGFDFHDACDSHDRCYGNQSNGSSSSERRRCDRQFLSDMRSACNVHKTYSSGWFACRTVAKSYYYGVRLLGAPFWDEYRSAPIA